VKNWRKEGEPIACSQFCAPVSALDLVPVLTIGSYRHRPPPPHRHPSTGRYKLVQRETVKINCPLPKPGCSGVPHIPPHIITHRGTSETHDRNHRCPKIPTLHTTSSSWNPTYPSPYSTASHTTVIIITTEITHAPPIKPGTQPSRTTPNDGTSTERGSTRASSGTMLGTATIKGRIERDAVWTPCTSSLDRRLRRRPGRCVVLVGGVGWSTVWP